ncbi:MULTISPECIES: exonuclease domain-containing protein [Vibrio]|uniref:Exonuclease domain-containing protein n=1 Tax=Vibrio tasmaniensis TaxID=212663 RepID=A0A2N7NCN6_9VIBR|nr:exonuclease domain-containing protein [Vibrio tasmaniensis]PMO89862.1 hypothetical protein BCT01_00855 [Vibrio tasmaniensis]PMP09966.1 hypothetical protein BCS92_02235 [Vibrio tasmaniensis]TKG27968.1 hypothetical protein FC057_22535 [Vibrio tasmaniensis]TKG40547.1 hypothetical protein FC060_23850 [Vibrio tasmaniensis]TKG41667.1 hypothetical protein FC063_07335 [Vibrio tasmaniensis]
MYWYIDLEISGNRAYDEVVELSIIESSSLTAEGSVIFNSLISGAESLTLEAQAITGISIEDLNDNSLPTISDVIDTIAERPNSTILVSYNLQFDLDFIHHSGMLTGDNRMERMMIKGICLLQAVKTYSGKHVSLDDSLGIRRSTHRSLYDTKLHMELHRRLGRVTTSKVESFIVNSTPEFIA